MLKKLLLIAYIALFFLCDTLKAEQGRQNELNKRAEITGPVFERSLFIGVSSDRIWQALIDPQVVNRYYLAPLSKIELRKGGAIIYGPRDQPMIEGKILEYTQGSKLVHTFKFAHRPSEPASRVSYEIEPMGDMSALILRHDQFPAENATFNDVRGGWDVILSSLKTLLETGKPLPWPKPQESGKAG